ncbi:MAG TPA: His/Gly/Thr/Pro-type tRNA ligase C-terminal domain-containing protein, partial [Clostridia bacterium]|nr:His/Gly/Thr/Pro-type tRNA ligase C-terminal domain-containing protein [Clostridia bacterium]
IFNQLQHAGYNVLKIDKRLAPIKIAVFPLLKNREELVNGAKSIYNALKKSFMCEFDDNGNVGKRYRRQDEIGTPYCVTFDFDSLNDNCVTVRYRDSMKQDRISIDSIMAFLDENIKI